MEVKELLGVVSSLLLMLDVEVARVGIGTIAKSQLGQGSS
jgi:hypothetical protein